MNLPSLIDEFLDYLLNIRGYSKTTVKTYEQSLRQMLSFSKLNIQEDPVVLNIIPLRRYISKNSRRTIVKKLSAIRSFVSYLNRQRGISIILEGEESIKVPKSLPKPIDEKYILEVMADANVMQQLILALLYGLGLRISELASLKRENIQGNWITITGKGSKSRQLPIPSRVYELLNSYLSLYPNSEYLFEKDGLAMNSSQLRYQIEKLFRSHGIKATPHQLRHSFATHLLERGARISDVSELLGHSSMATTQIYTKLGNAQKLREYMKAHPLGGTKGNK